MPMIEKHNVLTTSSLSQGAITVHCDFSFFKDLLIYLFDTEIERVREITSRQRDRQREVGEEGSLLSRKSDVGLDPKTLKP